MTTAFKELIYPAEVAWTICVKMRAKLDPSSVTAKMLLSTLLEFWDEDDEDELDRNRL